MQVALPLRQVTLRRVAQLLVVMVFLAGSSAIAWQAHQKAYDDLPTFYWATQLAYKDGLSAYQPAHFRQLGASLDRKIYPFLYPPPSLVVFAPFLLGSYEQVKAVFTVCNLLLWWLLTWALYRLYCVHSGNSQHWLASLLIPLWSLSFLPIADTFRTGQVNLLVLACLTPLFFPSSRYWRQLCSGILFAAAIMLKVYLLLVLPVLMITGQKKAALTAWVALLLLCLLSLLLFPLGVWSDWLALGLNSGGYGKHLPKVITVPWNQSINGFFIRQFLDENILRSATSSQWLIYVCSGALLAATFYTASMAIRHTARGAAMALALVVLVATLVAPLTWLHHYVFAMPAIVCCVALLSTLETSPYKTSMSAGALAAALLIGFPSLVGMVFPEQAAWKMADKTITLGANLVVSAQLVAGLAFSGFFAALILCCRETRPR